LADPTVDAVTLCTPIGLHYGQALKAIAAGKHMHIHKTMTTTKAEADDVIAAAKKAAIKLVASPNAGHYAATKRVREIIQSGELGRTYWAETGTSGGGHEYENFRKGDDILSNVNPTWYYKRPGGGPMYDMAVYSLHTITGMLGPVKRVTGMSSIGLKERTFKGETIKVEMDDNTHLVLDFGDDVYCLLYGTNSFGGPARPFAGVYISCARGAILRAGPGIEVWKAQEAWNQRSDEGHRVETPGNWMPFVTEAHVKLGESHVFSDVMHLADCILHDKTPVVSADHARHVIEIIELGYKAAQTGQAQDLTTTFALGELKEWTKLQS
jgi:predicted dehydrogenase